MNDLGEALVHPLIKKPAEYYCRRTIPHIFDSWKAAVFETITELEDPKRRSQPQISALLLSMASGETGKKTILLDRQFVRHVSDFDLAYGYTTSLRNVTYYYAPISIPGFFVAYASEAINQSSLFLPKRQPVQGVTQVQVGADS